VCLTHVKKRRAVSLEERREDEERSDLEPEATTRAPDREAGDREVEKEIERALAELSPRQRLTFTMKHYEGYKIREIAEMTGISDGAVKGYLFEATRRLRRRLAHLKDYLDDAE
jgi:RNA polymerase sigma-70 factor, ECF subfamily